jgi:hypothetical protein
MNATNSSWKLIGFILALVVGAVGCGKDSEQDGAAQSGTNASILIEPNQSVGRIHSGMTQRQVIEELGEPERKGADALEYSRLGLAVVPGADGLVQAVMCGDVIGINGPFVKAFLGRTKEGIGMYSTREDIIKAYGQPTEHKKLPTGLEWFQYQPLGITFTLEGGKVHHMVVQFGGPAGPDRSVTLEPKPAPEQK